MHGFFFFKFFSLYFFCIFFNLYTTILDRYVPGTTSTLDFYVLPLTTLDHSVSGTITTLDNFALRTIITFSSYCPLGTISSLDYYVIDFDYF